MILIASIYLFAQAPIESQPMAQSMLGQAEELAERYRSIVAKAPPPSPSPNANQALTLSSNWLSIDLSRIDPSGQTVLSSLTNGVFWDAVQEMGLDAVELKHLKGTANGPTRFKIDPSWGSELEYGKLSSFVLGRQIRLIGSLLNYSTGRGLDFALALKNTPSFIGLYQLIEIDHKDWHLLPTVQPGTLSENIPWMTLQMLHKMGYVPQDFSPYVKQSSWNATAPIEGVDQKIRRWIFLRDEDGNPCLDWLSATYGGERLAAGDILFSLYRLGQTYLQLGSNVPDSAKESLSLFARKLGAFTASVEQGGIESLKNGRTDLTFDRFTPMAALHALIAKDAEALRLIYRLFQAESIPLKSLIHPMEPFGRAPCDWAEFLEHPDKTYRYFETDLTGKALRERLLKEDLAALQESNLNTLSSWSGTCQAILGKKEIKNKQEELLKIQLLLAKFFAWQPGAFLISLEDLAGALPTDDNISISKTTGSTLYSPLPLQLKNPTSFASQLKLILRARSDYAIQRSDLVAVLPPKNKSLFLLLYRIPVSNMLVLLGVNFSRKTVEESIDHAEYGKTSAINLLTRLGEEKAFESSRFTLKLDPMDAKLILFQPRHY